MSVRCWTLGILAVCAVGCKIVDGKDRARQAAGAPQPGAQARPAQAGPSQAWLRGDLAAQRPDEASLTPKPGGEIVMQIYSNPPSLNRITHSDWFATRLTVPHIYEPLLIHDAASHPEYRIVPRLAERFEVSEDKKTFTVFLRKGVRFHDGKPFSARDVKATFDKIRDETTRAAHMRSYIEELDRLEVIDPYTVRFVFKRPYFLALDALASTPIQPAHIIEKLTGAQYNEASSNPLQRHPIGTGPFKFKAWEPNQKIVFERNDDYWGKKALLDRIVFRIVLEPDVAMQLAERGELDVLTRIMPEKWRDMADNPVLVAKFHRSKEEDNNYAWIGWNLERPYFKDRRVRRALTMLVDRPSIVNKLFYGLYEATDCHFYKRADYLCRTDKPPIPYDPVAAAKLLDEAGWRDTDGDGVRDKGGAKFAFTFMVPASSETAKRMVALIKEDFARAGIEMGLQLVEWSAYTERLRERSFDACTLLWGSDTPRDDPTQIWHSRSVKGGSNYIGFRNPRVDALLEQARVEFDDDKRNALYREFMDILRDEQPYTWIYTRPRVFLYSHRLRGVHNSLLGFNFSDWWVYEG